MFTIFKKYWGVCEEKIFILIFLLLTMEELWRHLNMAGCFM